MIGVSSDADSPGSPALAAFESPRAPTEPPRSGAALELLRGGADDLLRVRDVAERLGVCTATVYKLCDRGELAHVRVMNALRVAPADLETFVAARRR